MAAAQAQHTGLPGQKRAAVPVRDLAHRLLELDAQIKDNDGRIRNAFRADPRAEIIESMPGMGPILGAEFIAIVGDLSGYADAGRLASHAGLAPVPRDSGRRTGNLHRPKHYNRRLRHIFSMAAQTAMMRPGPSRDYYRANAPKDSSTPRRSWPWRAARVDVLWAMPRDNRRSPPLHRSRKRLDSVIEFLVVCVVSVIGA